MLRIINVKVLSAGFDTFVCVNLGDLIPENLTFFMQLIETLGLPFLPIRWVHLPTLIGFEVSQFILQLDDSLLAFFSEVLVSFDVGFDSFGSRLQHFDAINDSSQLCTVVLGLREVVQLLVLFLFDVSETLDLAKQFSLLLLEVK